MVEDRKEMDYMNQQIEHYVMEKQNFRRKNKRN